LSTKSRVAGLLAVLAIGFLLFGPEDEPSHSDEQGNDSESETERRLVPREPSFRPPGQEDYGLAGRPGRSGADTYRGGWGSPDANSYSPDSYPPRSYPPAPHQRDPHGGYGGRGSFAGRDDMSMGGYRFRPFDVPEKQRVREQPADRFPPPHSGPVARPWQNAPAPYSPYSSERGYYRTEPQSYSYRPLRKSPQARGRWQGPYGDPGWHPDWSPSDPWSAPPDPQWGSTPPSQRMYPSFHLDSGRRITSR
jgi:hypothetical protein